MPLPVSILDALNEQLTLERTAHATYRAFVGNLESLNFPGMAAWFKKQSDEEQSHADKIMTYLADRGDLPIFDALDAVDLGKGWNPPAYFDKSLGLEQSVTASLKEKWTLAMEQDPQTAAFLDWFLLEQVEGEKTVEEIIDMFKRAGSGLGYVVMDERLAEMAK